MLRKALFLIALLITLGVKAESASEIPTNLDKGVATVMVTEHNTNQMQAVAESRRWPRWLRRLLHRRGKGDRRPGGR
ncbi:MAG: hypothetical protein ABR88_00055 [Cryomorphaceae bacterium BACL7 MAG-120322-bin74]|jgi:hypothetical protein|nr:MAG: hypothetical protein ABR88_00055 [Cryomorphaceae bacterium BACL7 MAG-120322-bin74]